MTKILNQNGKTLIRGLHDGKKGDSVIYGFERRNKKEFLVERNPIKDNENYMLKPQGMETRKGRTPCWIMSSKSKKDSHSTGNLGNFGFLTSCLPETNN